MRTWRRAPQRTKRNVPGVQCGRCPSQMSNGTPYLVITTEQGSMLLRCAPCADRMFGEKPPADIPDDVSVAPQPSLPIETLERKPHFATPKNWARNHPLRDVKALQSGDREPGAEG